MKHHEVFTPITSDPRVRTIGALDLEGQGGDDGFESGVIVLGRNRYFVKDRDELLSVLLAHRHRGVHFYVHYLTYDFGMLLPYIPVPYKALMVRGKVYRVSMYPAQKQVIHLNDSLGLFYNLPLSAIGKAIGLPKLPTPPRLLGESATVPEWSCTSHNRLWCVECYNLRDAQIVDRAVKMLQETMLDLGSDLRNTIASTAMILFRRCFLDTDYVKPWPYRNDFARLGYYGGRVEPFIMGLVQDQNYYDVHSLYPAMMKRYPFPDPNTLHGPWLNSDPKFIHEYEGFSDVLVECPPMHVPVLPYRTAGKLYFPIGTFRGVWAHCELRYALSQGYKIKEVYRTMFAWKVCHPFGDYVDTLYRMRRTAKRMGDPRHLVYKVMMNSLYGKFGQRCDGGLEQLFPLEDFDDKDDLTGMSTFELMNRVYVRKAIYTAHEPSYIIVPWAAYVTAYGRIHLHQVMQEADFDVAYTDTDSLFTSHRLPTGIELGELGKIELNVDLEVYAPKFYRYRSVDGAEKIACKGVPIEYRSEYVSQKQVTFRKAVGIYEAVVRKLTPSEWIEVTRRMRFADPKREYYSQRGDPKSTMYSRPWDVNRLP